MGRGSRERGQPLDVADLGKGAAARRGGPWISADLGGSRAVVRGARRFTIARGWRAVA